MNQPRQRQAPPAPPAPPNPQETAVPAETPTTDEELLDQALTETFPASDPISPGAGVREPLHPPAGHPSPHRKKP